MDRLKQKLKKEKQAKESGKDKYPLFITDVKSIKENLKIKEILRTVKMNSSMRLKGPPGSKIMNNKDFNEEDCFEESSINENSNEPLSAVNPDVDTTNADLEDKEVVEKEVNINENEFNSECVNRNDIETSEVSHFTQNEGQSENENSVIHTQSEINENDSDEIDNLTMSLSNGKLTEKNRDRKLSLDHTMLSRQDGFSQSELDLHTIGKSPLERKYSFFRKKMDSFVRNTTEMFRRQNSFLQRRGSMSVSLQSLNDNNCNKSEIIETIFPPPHEQEPHGSRTSLQASPPPIVRSTSSLSLVQSRNLPSSSSQNSLAGSQNALNSVTSEELNSNSNSVQSLNEIYLKEAMLNSRAISMSSGLDAPFGQQRRKASRSNRVTWIASEGLTNYLRRKIQDEKNEMQACHSYQDFSCIPENELYSQKPDSKGRRLSYQRAVSGEDPMPMPIKHQDSTSRRKHHFLENHEPNYELANILTDFTNNGVPTLQGFDVEPIPEESFAYLQWATKQENVADSYDLNTLPEKEISKQSVIRELVYTEAKYIQHLMLLVEIFIAAAHAIQLKGKMLAIDTVQLFSNLPDLLNASLYFWNLAYVPMLIDALTNSRPFNPDFLIAGFTLFRNIFVPYEKFVVEQNKLLEYYRQKQQTVPEFAMYIAWCHEHKECQRLRLNDLLVKPMQRMTKYSLLLRRIINKTEDAAKIAAYEALEFLTTSHLIDLNRSVRQREELDKLEQLEKTIECFEFAVKDEEAERICKSFAKLNLKAPMLYCLPNHKRNVIHQGELRFRDGNTKEIDVRVMLLTDMLLVCRKLARGIANQYKLIRPKYMIDKLIQIPKFDSKNKKDLSSLLYVLVDDLGSAYASFALSEMPKDPDPQQTLKTWEDKFKEAKLTYELITLIANNPNKELDKTDVAKVATLMNTKLSLPHENPIMEQAVRERVATVIHRSMGASNDRNFSQISSDTQNFESFPYAPNQIVLGASTRLPGRNKKLCVVHRTTTIQQTSTPRVYPVTSLTQSPSAHPLSETQPRRSRVVKRISISPDRLLQLPSDTSGGSSITVNVTESESEMAKLHTPSLQASPSKSSECSSTSTKSTLRVLPQSNEDTLIYSLPDLTIEPCTPRSTTSPTQASASERMYQSHHELLQRNRLTTQTQQYLTPDHRGSSYPPPSPTRGSLKRSLAFSYSFKSPPLSKMGHVSSHSQIDTILSSQTQDDRGGSPKPGRSEKSDKKSKLTSSSSFFGSVGWNTKQDE